jgi:hypothetical protein
MAGQIHDLLPQYQIDNTVNGFAPLGRSTNYYSCQRIFKTVQKVPELQQLEYKGAPLRIVDVPAGSVFRDLPERYREGILRIQGKWEIEGKTGVSEITIFDLYGKGIVPKELFQERYEQLTVKTKPEEIPVAVPKKGLDAYIEYSKKTQEDKLKLQNDPPTELILSQAEAAELAQELTKIGIEGLKARGVESLTVMRIQEHIYGLTNRPAVFVGDLFFFLGVDNPTTAKVMIGYNEKCSKEYMDNQVMIWDADINDLMESNWKNAREVFEEYVRWGKEWYDFSGMDMGKPPAHFLETFKGNPDGMKRSLESLETFMINSNKYGFLKDDFTSNLTDDLWEEAWEARKALVPEEGMLDRMEKEIDIEGIKPGEFALQRPEYGLGKLIESVGFFDLFSGDGRSRAYTGKQGAKEWLLLRRKPDSFNNKNLEKLTKDKTIEQIFK